MPVNAALVVAVSAIAPLVLRRVHRLSEQHPELVAVPASGVSSAPEELTEQVVVERDQAPADVARFAPGLGP